MHTNRMFEIIYVLLNKKNVTAKELAERFGVSARTIYRDIDALSLAGIPVYTEKGKGGGIRLLPDFVLNKSLLSEREQNVILTALHGLSSVKAEYADDVIGKLSTLFNKTTTKWLEVDFSEWGSSNDFFDGFKTAILTRRVTEFDYFSANGDKSFRRIEPIQLWFKEKAWYIKGFCHTRLDIRLFKLSRVKNMRVTDESFERDVLCEHFAAKKPESNEHLTIVKLRIEQEMAHRVYDEFEEGIVAKQQDGSFLVTLACHEDNWLFGFLLSFGEHLKVLEPEQIRKAVCVKAHRILQNYV